MEKNRVQHVLLGALGSLGVSAHSVGHPGNVTHQPLYQSALRADSDTRKSKCFDTLESSLALKASFKEKFYEFESICQYLLCWSSGHYTRPVLPTELVVLFLSLLLSPEWLII